MIAVASMAFSVVSPDTIRGDAREHLHKVDADNSVLAALYSEQAGTTVNGLEDVVADLECEDGTTGVWACDSVDLASFVPLRSFKGKARGEFELSDVWGWVDPATADEYVIAGTTQGAVFFRVTDPTAPEFLGRIPNPGTTARIWHDIKVFNDHAFIVSESYAHGMLVFDLTRLRDLEADVTTRRELGPDTVYAPDSDAHNVVINETNGHAYMVGSARSVHTPSAPWRRNL